MLNEPVQRMDLELTLESSPAFRVLSAVATKTPQEATITEIGKETKLLQPQITFQINVLEKHGFISKKISDQDARIRVISINEDGLLKIGKKVFLERKMFWDERFEEEKLFSKMFGIACSMPFISSIQNGFIFMELIAKDKALFNTAGKLGYTKNFDELKKVIETKALQK